MNKNKGKNYKKSNKKTYNKPLTYNAVKNMINKTVEFKTKDFDDTAASGLINKWINQISRGSLPDQCIGNEYNIRSVQIRGVLTHTVAGSTRIVVLYDKRERGVRTEADVYNEYIAGSTANAIALRNLDVKRHFVVLYDKLHVMTPETTLRKVVNIYKKCNLPVVIDTIGSGSTASGTLYLLMFSTSGTTTFPSYTRVRFTE